MYILIHVCFCGGGQNVIPGECDRAEDGGRQLGSLLVQAGGQGMSKRCYMTSALSQLTSGPGSYLGKSDLDKGNNESKALEVKTCLAYLKNSKKGHEARVVTEGDRSWR